MLSTFVESLQTYLSSLKTGVTLMTSGCGYDYYLKYYEVNHKVCIATVGYLERILISSFL